jgi:hypothetical protein
MMKKSNEGKMNRLGIMIMILSALLLFICGCKKTGNNIDEKIREITLPDKTFPLVIKKEYEKYIDVVAKEPPGLSKVDDRNHIYVYFLWNKNRDTEVLKMNTNLEIKRDYLIKYGEGPGSTLNPRIYGGDERSIIVYDILHRKYVEYDSDFQLIREFRNKRYSQYYYVRGKYIPGQRLILDAFEKNSFEQTVRTKIANVGIYISKLTDAREVESTCIYEQSYKTEDKKKRFLLGYPFHYLYCFDHIYILDKVNYRLIKMNLKGEILVNKKIKFERKTLSASDREKWVKQFLPLAKDWYEYDYPEDLMPACWMLPIGNGIAVGRCEDYDLDRKGPITADYFDKDLNFLGKISIPYFRAWNNPSQGVVQAEISVLYKDGKLYTIETRGDDEDEYWIVRWSVETK